jgi:outer membrane biosynthesis protein TonB
MKTNAAFSSENLLVSVAGHLGIVALLVTSFAVLNPMDKVVMSDHVQIYEIDLSQVQIKGGETLVFNTDAPEAKDEETETKNEPEKKAEPKQEPAAPFGDDKPPLNPELMPEKKKELPDVTKADPVQAPEENPASPESPAQADEPQKHDVPKAPTIVRVNRETTSLNRTMTLSVVDALRVAMTRCWVFDRNYPGIEEIRAVAHLSMNQRGYVSSMWFEQESAAAENPPLAYIFETIRAAIASCQPFGMLPENEFETWKTIQLTFYPSSGKVQ